MTKLDQRSVPYLGEAVKRLRGFAAKTQGTLAKEAGVSSTYLSMIEKGLRTPDLGTLAKIAKALGFRLSEVLHLAERLEDKPHLRPDLPKEGS